MKIHKLKNEGVYILINTVTKDCYIGSSYNIGNRKSKHFSLLKHNKHQNSLIQDSYNIYGELNFKLGVLEFVTNDLSTREQYYIDKYNPKFNITRDVINNTPSLESRKKMSTTRTRLMSEGVIKKTGCRPVLVFDLKGNFINEFESVTETARILNIATTGVHLVLKGKYKQIKGNVFKYKSDLIKPCELLENPGEDNQQPIFTEMY